MIVTINTDASFNRQYNVGTFAFWIVSNSGRICKSGVLREKVTRPEQAEFKCIMNALHVLGKAGYAGITQIIVNTDCLNVIHLVKKNLKPIKKYRLNDWGEELVNQFEDILKKTGIQAAIELRHVRSHVSTDTKRQWVNEWCDVEAKKEMKKALKKLRA